MCLKYFGVLYRHTLATRSIKNSLNMRSILKSMSYTSPVSAPLRQVHPFFWQKTLTDGPTGARWSKLLSWGTAGVLKRAGNTSGVSSASTSSISFGVLYYGYTIKYFGVRYCGYSGTRSALTSHTPQYSQYSGLRYCSYSQHSQYSGLQYCSYSQYSQYKMYSILRVYLKYEVYWQHLCII